MTVKLFTYSAYQDCTKGFHLVTRKDVALAGGEFHRTGRSLRVEKVVLDETRVAALHLDKGAFVNFFQFGGISEKRGVQNIKLLKGTDLAAPFWINLRYQLIQRRTTGRVEERVTAYFSSVSVLAGRTLSFSNRERIGEANCLTEQQRQVVANDVQYYPRKVACYVHKAPPSAFPPVVALEQGAYSPTPAEHAQEELEVEREAEAAGEEQVRTVTAADLLLVSQKLVSQKLRRVVLLDCGREGGRRRPKIRWMKAGMGVLGGASFGAWIGDMRRTKSRVSARWRWAASRARVGAAAATVIALVIERQINGFMGFRAGTGSASRSLKRTAIELNK